MEANTSVSTFSPTNVNDSNNNTQKLKTSEMAPVYYCECKWKIKRGRLGNEASTKQKSMISSQTLSHPPEQ